MTLQSLKLLIDEAIEALQLGRKLSLTAQQPSHTRNAQAKFQQVHNALVTIKEHCESLTPILSTSKAVDSIDSDNMVKLTPKDLVEEITDSNDKSEQNFDEIKEEVQLKEKEQVLKTTSKTSRTKNKRST